MLWLRRDLRLHDNAAMMAALAEKAPVQAVFIFDSDILAQFARRDDRRLSFIATALCRMDAKLAAKGGGGIVALHGRAEVLVPKLVQALGAVQVSAAEDYEPGARARDAAVGRALGAQLRLVRDQVIFGPEDILREGEAPYKVFTPYAKAWRAKLTAAHVATLHGKGMLADIAQSRRACEAAGFEPLDFSRGPGHLLAQVGYDYAQDDLWGVDDGQRRLKGFLAHHAKDYKAMRNFMAVEGTSRLSPYLRFGLVSVRECVQGALEAGADTWLSELIWREFYAMNLFHFPESATTEWNPRWRGVLEWSGNEAHFTAWQEGRTGYPVVDAAMRQLLAEGWMHNRARMIVASFLTKHLRIDWRKGEEHFAQWLMDYDMASNVGGWQWAASTGTDAQPYFRVFNPRLQSEKFDPKGEYIRKFVPELRGVGGEDIHVPGGAYIAPIVEHGAAREAALAMFKRGT